MGPPETRHAVEEFTEWGLVELKIRTNIDFIKQLLMRQMLPIDMYIVHIHIRTLDIPILNILSAGQFFSAFNKYYIRYVG